MKRSLSALLCASAFFATAHCNSGITNFLDDKGPDAWTRRCKITINNAAQAENLLNFPVMVRIDSTRIDYAKTQDAGQDLQFRDSDGKTILSHEIEKWNEAGSSYIWVRVPQIDASSASDYIWMYYGNAAASDGQSSSAVWNSGYSSVWHFSDTTSTRDSSANSFSGTPTGISAVAGQIGDAYSFNGTSGWINLGNNKSILVGSSAITLSGWYYFPATVSTTEQLIAVSINFGTPTSSSRATMAAVPTNQIQSGGRAPDSTATLQVQTSNVGGGVLSAANWLFVTSVIDYNAKDIAFYVNGTVVSDDDSALGWAASALDSTTSASAALGSEDDGSGTFFSGRMDEVRFSNSARSAAWIAAEYKSGKDTFLSFGFEEKDPSLP